MPVVTTTFSLLVGVAGWYYLFYSKAAGRLAGVEPSGVNDRRRRLRRVNASVLLVLAGLCYAGFTVRTPKAFVVIWCTVIVLLAVVLGLTAIDVRLTAKLRRRLKP